MYVFKVNKCLFWDKKSLEIASCATVKALELPEDAVTNGSCGDHRKLWQAAGIAINMMENLFFFYYWFPSELQQMQTSDW